MFQHRSSETYRYTEGDDETVLKTWAFVKGKKQEKTQDKVSDFFSSLSEFRWWYCLSGDTYHLAEYSSDFLLLNDGYKYKWLWQEVEVQSEVGILGPLKPWDRYELSL